MASRYQISLRNGRFAVTFAADPGTTLWADTLAGAIADAKAFLAAI